MHQGQVHPRIPEQMRVRPARKGRIAELENQELSRRATVSSPARVKAARGSEYYQPREPVELLRHGPFCQGKIIALATIMRHATMMEAV